MSFTDKQVYHGAVLYQIAEHPQFTAINVLKIDGRTSHNAFRINDDIAVYPKIGSEPSGRYHEYRFTFTTDQLLEIASIADQGNELYLALVCVKDREICCLRYDQLSSLIDARKSRLDRDEQQYVVLVTLEARQRFRVNMNAGDTMGMYVGNPILVPRNACPERMFRS